MTGRNQLYAGKIPPIYRTSATNTMDHSIMVLRARILICF